MRWPRIAFCSGFLFMLLLLPGGPLAAQQSGLPRFSFLSISQPATLEDRLNYAAGNGARVVLVGANLRQGSMPILLERMAAAPGYEYSVLSAGKGDLQAALNDYGARGFRMVPGSSLTSFAADKLATAFGNPNLRRPEAFQILVEKPPGPVAKREYRVIRKILWTLASQDPLFHGKGAIREAAAEGFRIVELLEPDYVILERDAAVRTPGVAKEQYRMVANKRFANLQIELNSAVYGGYRVVAACSGQIDERTRGQVVIALEKAEAGSAAFDYLLLNSYTAGDLQKQLNNGGRNGYRLLPHSLLTTATGFPVLLMESATVRPHTFEYKVVFDIDLVRLAAAIADEAEAGFAPVALLGTHETLVVLQKSTSPGAPPAATGGAR